MVFFMSEEPKENTNYPIATDTEPSAEEREFEAKQNLLGFFDLLLKIDMRNNPEIYKKKVNEQDENNRNTNNSD